MARATGPVEESGLMPTGPRPLLRPKQWAVRLVEGWSSGAGATTLWTWLGADMYLERLPFEPAVRDADSMSSPTKTETGK